MDDMINQELYFTLYGKRNITTHGTIIKSDDDTNDVNKEDLKLSYNVNNVKKRIRRNAIFEMKSR
jgi:hypothetical protein|uniref:Uncharacterized protein n=1 Tax=viral metagenome TaxID=1070528 RepID=A0A6C0BPK0_9ZZZZ